jgi:peptidoglycan-N-acetylglucosamine deacetylase
VKGLLLWGLLIFFMVYAMIPRIVLFTFGLGAFKKGRVRNEIAFTFDDGPDPIYTPRLLDLLKKYQVKATFFVVGSKAEKYPELILRMHHEGHLIGIHNYVHHTNWLMAPWVVKRQIDRSANIIERITGIRPTYYRPPWGLPNLFDIGLRKQFQIVLWSLMVGDWKSRGGKDKIKRRLLDRITGGSVIVLHDCGETFGADVDAPVHMIEALEDVLSEVRMQGYTCVRIDEMIQMDQERSARPLRKDVSGTVSH